jgi:DNA-binding transcriptional MerR regulator
MTANPLGGHPSANGLNAAEAQHLLEGADGTTVSTDRVRLADLLEELRAIRRHLAQRHHEVLAVGMRDLARMLGVSGATLARWKAAGLLLPGLRKNGRILYPLDQVRRWLAAGMPDAKTWKTMQQS